MGLSYSSVYDQLWRMQARLVRSPSVAFVAQLQSLERASRTELQELQWLKLKALLEHAYNQVPFYRQRFDHLGLHPEDVRTPSDFANIPVLTRSELQNNQAALVAKNIDRRMLIKDSTGGSTGKPVHFHIDQQYRHWTGSIIRVQDGWTGLRRGDPHAFLWGARIDLAKQQESVKAMAANAIKRNLFLDSFKLDDNSLRAYTHQLAKFKPKLLTGYVLALQVLARFVERESLPVPRVGAVQTGAEPLHAAQRRFIGDVFQAEVFERYGGRDIGAIAHECEAHRGMHIFAGNYVVESVVDGRPVLANETGELIVTHLDNYGAPFIRYRSEDLGAISDRVCPCGRSYPMLERVEGRVLDIIVGENGRVLPGEFFPHFFKDFDLGEFQVVQKRRDMIEIKLVRGREFTERHEADIKATIRAYLGQRTHIDINMVDSIPRTASGKFRVAISEVSSQWTTPTRTNNDNC